MNANSRIIDAWTERNSKAANIYNSEAEARDCARRHGLSVENLTWTEIIDVIEEWEEENC